MRLIVTVFLMVLLVGCTSTKIESTEKIDTDSKVYIREITEEEREYIQLVLDKKYEDLLGLTENKNNELQKDYNNVAVAFIKQIEIGQLLSEGDEYTREQMLPLKYGAIIKSVESIKYIPSELQNSINSLYRKSIREKEKYDIKEKERKEVLMRIRTERAEMELEYYNSIPRIGMTTEEALNSSWGEPKDINKTTTQYGTSEQWVYYGYRYLYFDDGILTAIQE